MHLQITLLIQIPYNITIKMNWLDNQYLPYLKMFMANTSHIDDRLWFAT